MSPLTCSHKREIRQLWDVAVTYWELAKATMKDMPDEHMLLTCDKISEYYDAAVPTGSSEKRPNILLAHLSSAAIRLVTIDERLEKAGCRVSPKYLALYTSSSPADFEAWINSNFADFVHQILRDNAAHIEEANDRDANKEKLYRARQKVILGKTLREIVNAFDAVMKKFTPELSKRAVIPVPSSSRTRVK